MSSNCNERMPAVAISACQGHMGKTVVSTGICAALAATGWAIQPFKKGPDYIDPSWLSAASGRACRNVDAFQMSEAAILHSFQRGCQGADLALMEGVMGLYDSYDPNGKGSTAWMARLLGMPVILVINGSRMGRSVAAMIRGYQEFEPQTRVAGVILNNVSLSGHRKKLMRAIEQYCDIPVVGTIPPDKEISVNEQHLGLRPYQAVDNGGETVRRIGEKISNYLDLEQVLAIAQESNSYKTPLLEACAKSPSVRIGVLFDKAFNFYYPANFEALSQAGAELVFINSLQDWRLPDIDGLYIGGGFPELFGEELEANAGLRQEIACAIETGMPVYAECAGIAYLSRELRWGNRRYEMVGAIPADVEMCGEPQGHGYVVAEVAEENPWFPLGSTVYGHQFHHSRLCNADGLRFAYRMKRTRYNDSKVDGIVHRKVLAAYTHLHALGIPQWAGTFVSLAARNSKYESYPVLDYRSRVLA